MKKQLIQAAVVALLALGFCGASVPAAEAQRVPLSRYVRSRWTQRDGLPHNSVQGVLAARSGYIWFGSQEGLLRFDGSRVRLFERFSTPGLAGDEVIALAEDAAGDIWIGTYSGLSRLHGESFEVIDPGDGPATAVLAMEWDGSDLWVGTAAGLHRLHNGAWSAYRLDAARGGEQITALRQARGGGLWIGTRGSLFRWSEGRVDAVEAQGLASDGISSILEDRGGTVWAGTAHGLMRRRPGQAAFEPVAGVGDRAVMSLLQDQTGALWVGSITRLLRIVGEHVEVLPGRPLRFDSIVEDAEGSIWLGTETEGLQRLRQGKLETISLEEGLSSEVIWAVVEGADGAVWASGDGGLDRIVMGRPVRSFERYTRGANPTSALVDRSGDLWLGTQKHGLLHFAAQGVTQYGKAQNILGVRVVFQDRSGAIWVGSNTGLSRLAGKRFVSSGSSAPVNTIAQGPDGVLWVGTSSGLLRGEGGRLVPAPLPGWTGPRDVTALQIDADGTLWLGTNGDGLWRWRDGKARNINRRHGLREDILFTVLDDLRGSFWFSGNHGISRVRRAELEEVAEGRLERVSVEAMGRAEGMKEAECTGGLQPAGIRTRDGRLWFATMKGVVVVDPSRILANPIPPRIILEDVVADGRRFAPQAGLRLAPGTRHLEIRYTAIGTAAERIRFRHRLDGLDKENVQAGGERVAHYAGLRPGRYVFHLEAANESGVWSRQGESLAFVIEPQFWESHWFRLLGALALLGGLFGYFRFRVRRLRAQRRELAARVAEEMKKVKVLSGLLPLCAWCRKIRDDAGAWQTLEEYVTAQTDAAISHGMCPDCYDRMKASRS